MYGIGYWCYIVVNGKLFEKKGLLKVFVVFFFVYENFFLNLSICFFGYRLFFVYVCFFGFSRVIGLLKSIVLLDRILNIVIGDFF